MKRASDKKQFLKGVVNKSRSVTELRGELDIVYLLDLNSDGGYTDSKGNKHTREQIKALIPGKTIIAIPGIAKFNWVGHSRLKLF